MNLSTWSVKNNRTATVLFFLIAVVGIQTYFTIPRLENPEFTVRLALVQTVFPGASPERVEQLVTSKIEKKIREMGELKNIISESRTGVSIITAEFEEQYDDMEPIFKRLRNKVDDAKRELPKEAGVPIVNDEFGDVFGIVIALTGDGYSYREMEDYAEDIRDELLSLDMVAKVEIHGTQEERIFIDFSNSLLAEYRLSPNQLGEYLAAQNVIQPGGDARVGPERIVIEPTGEFESLEQIEKTSIRFPGQPEAVSLKDIATITRDYVDPPSEMTRFNGQPCLCIAINMTDDGNIVELGERVKERLRELWTNIPIGLEYGIVSFQPKFVQRSIKEFMINLLEAFVFVIIVMLLFAGLRLGLIAGSLVPMAMLMCMALMPFFDVVLQQISIAALIISLGILVDNGVVISENMLVRIASGENRMKAVEGTNRELSTPLLIASMTTVFAFLPIPLADSVVGEFTLSLFIVVSLTLASSWLLSQTMIPLLCYYFLKPRKQKQDYSGRLHSGYRSLLTRVLKARILFLIALGLALWGGLILFGMIPTIFFPPNDREQFLVDFWQPYGTDIRVTADRVAQLEDFLLRDERVETVSSFVGYGGPRWYLSLNPEQKNPSYSMLLVNTKRYKGTPELIEQTRDYLDRMFPDLRYSVNALEHGPPVGAPIQIRISGERIDTLYELRDRIAERIASIPGVTNIRDNWGEWTKKLVVDVNQEQAKFAGLSSREIALSLQSQISGMEATAYREDDEIIPIILRGQDADREDIGKIEGLNVFSYQTALSVPLMRVADTRLVWQASNIRRRDEERTLTVKTDVHGRYASNVLADIRPIVEKMKAAPDWPYDYHVEYGGEFEESREANQSIMEKLPVALGAIILVLVFQFNSIRRPLIIALTVPPMFIGIAIGLYITDAPFGFMALLGVISLTGIIVNNAIMLIDRIEIEQERDQSPQDAIVIAAQRRMRPILMTTITTIVGLIPLSLQGGEMWRPMANTIIFGLAFATILTLLLCPVLYSLLFKVNFKKYQWNPGVLAKSDD